MGGTGGDPVGLGGTDVGGGHSFAGAESDAGSAGASDTGGSGGGGAGGTPDPDPDAGADPGNLIVNPGFESGVAPWSVISGGGVFNLSTEQPRSGAQCGQVTNRGATYHGPSYDLTSVLMSGETYAFTAYGRIGNASSATLVMTMREICSGSSPKYVTISPGALASDTGWVELTGAYTVPSAESCTPQELRMYIEGPEAGIDIYVDDAEVRRF